MSRNAVSDFGNTSRDIARRVSDCVGELQVNDMTNQRIEHAWKALAVICDVIELGNAALAQHAWAEALEEDQKLALLSTVCQLQGKQLEGAMGDFTREVGELTAHLHALSDIAGEVMQRAGAILGAGDSSRSFVGDLREHTVGAMSLLASYSDAQAGMRGHVDAVVDGFSELARNVDDVRSVDEDMRLMGLNATLKCARLGSSGAALGVVAQELRACSRRTEEAARPISEVVEATRTAAGRLTALVADGQTRAHEISSALDSSLRALVGLEAALESSFAPLRDDCTGVLDLMQTACEGFAIDRSLPAVLARAMKRLSRIAGAAQVEETASLVGRDEILRLLGEQYTMASERNIHDQFTGVSKAGSAAGGSASVEEFFF